MMIAMFSCFIWRCTLLACFVLMIPMILDGCIQMWTSYESNNRRRFVTGFLFGYGLLMILVISSMELGLEEI